MDFTLIQPAGLRAAWPRVRESLDAVLAKAADDWIPEDVYHSLKCGDAACHIATNDTGYAGILVTTLARAEFSGTPALHVWIAHNAGNADVFEAGLGLLRQMARKAGASRITFGSPRLGWAKRFPLVSATYEVPL